MKPEQPRSPRLARLEADLAAGERQAVLRFWSEVAGEGAPLIEPIEEDDAASLVTFLWRSDGTTESVAVVAGIGSITREDSAMTRLRDTDLWYRTARLPNDFRLSYSLSPNDPLNPWDEIQDWQAEVARWIPDPLNPHRWIIPAYPDVQGSKEEVQSILELPDAPPHPWSDPRENVPAGRVDHHRLRSEILGDERSIFVYTPPGYEPSRQPYPLLVAFDGLAYVTTVPTPTILDNLQAEGRIPPTVALIVQSNEARGQMLSCYPPFVRFLATELLPWARARYSITADPAQTVVAGSSLGGLAATFTAFQYPEVFGNVLSQSGSYWWSPDGDREPEWLTRQLAARARLPLRFYLDVGRFEQGALRGGQPSQLMANRHLRDVLTAREYPLQYAEYMGGHDYLWWRDTLADGLLWLLGDERLRREQR